MRNLAVTAKAAQFCDADSSEAADSLRDVVEMPARILLAEDEKPIRTILANALRQHNYEVIEAKDGKEAIEKALKIRPHLAIIDLRMPEVDGFEVIRRLKARYGAELFVMVLSALNQDRERMMAFEAGAEDFVAKPVPIPEVVKRVEVFERTRRAIAEAKLANERADRLRLFAAEAAALLAHDLLNGLSVCIPNLQYLGDYRDTFDGEMQDAIEQSLHSLRRMKGLVRNFADISRLEDAALTPERVPIDIAKLLRETAFIHKNPHRASAGGDSWHIDVDAPDELVVSVDPVLIERVIHNLLGNATRYVDKKNGYIRIRTSVLEENEGGQLVISIGNVGPAIPPAMRADLFDKYRCGPDGKAQRGMGLYFCRLACEAHGGTIALEVADEFPTEFVIRLPI
ncbi:MAG: hybrid sensor histidine kinase/response regulator [Proteobacteria bacterium]|nr:hybrid sensor histidine kinase/response regulator [Pseudomonadota bacterium]